MTELDISEADLCRLQLFLNRFAIEPQKIEFFRGRIERLKTRSPYETSATHGLLLRAHESRFNVPQVLFLGLEFKGLSR